MWDNVVAVVMSGIHEVARLTHVLQGQMVLLSCISLISDAMMKHSLAESSLEKGRPYLAYNSRL